MIKVQALQDFTLEKFDELQNIKRTSAKNKNGELYLGDIFECDENMVKYLTGGNEKGITVVKIIEITPKTTFVIGSKDEEHVVTLDEENLEKVNKTIENYIKKSRKKR